MWLKTTRRKTPSSAASDVYKRQAIMVTDAEAPEKLVDAMLATVNDEDKLHSLSANVLRMALLNSAERIVDEVEKIINENDK